MKLLQKIGLGLDVLTAAGIIVYVIKRRSSSNARLMLNQKADEGCETANDVLFPEKNIQAKQLRSGPVIHE